MIRALKALFELPGNESAESEEKRMQLAAAALLIETARADFGQNAAEEAALEALVSSTLQLERAEVHQLIELASQNVDASTSLYQFTSVINDYK